MSQVSSGLITRTAPQASVPYTGLARVSLPTAKAAKKSQWVSNGYKTRQMMVWKPVNNKCAPPPAVCGHGYLLPCPCHAFTYLASRLELGQALLSACTH